MSSSTFPTRLKKIRKAAEDAGWTPDRTKAGHPRLNPPKGLRHVLDSQGSPIHGEVSMEGNGPLVAPVTFAKTPSDIAGDRNSRGALRRAGVAL